MARLGFNIDEYHDQYELLPEGEYNMVITKIDIEENEALREERIVMTLSVLDGEYKNNSVIQYYKIVQPDEKRQTTARNMFAGVVKSALGTSNLPNNDTDILEKKIVNVTIVHREYNGKTYANVGRISPAKPDDNGNKPNYEEVPF